MENTKYSQQATLLFATFIIAICGLIYELLVSTLSSYLLGDSIYQFSLVIGLFMSSMGIGSWLSRFFSKELPAHFVRLQLLVGFLGGISAPLLFFAFAVLGNYSPFLFLVVIILGSLLGIELPLIIRILKEHFPLKTNLSNVFTADYIGALIAALLFPLVLIPQLGVMQASLLIGLFNIGIGLLALYVFRHVIHQSTRLFVIGGGLTLLLGIGMFLSSSYVTLMESRLYQDHIIHTQNSSYQQRLVLTKRGERVRFFINGALQFDSVDEYRYHETLVHPAMGLTSTVENVLVLGGGDGLVARELLKYDPIQAITIVDLDPAVTNLFQHNELLKPINKDALNANKVNVVNQDAWKYLEQNNALFDLIIIDLPDPNNISLSRLYSNVFYQLLKTHLSQNGVIVTQATSPLFARKAFWSIEETLQQSINMADGMEETWFTLPYHVYIPSFGEWGFVMASRRKLDVEEMALPDLDYRFLNADIVKKLFEFPQDMSKVDVDVNRLSTHVLLEYYESGWKKWYE